jgi:hypothetical protein
MRYEAILKFMDLWSFVLGKQKGNQDAICCNEICKKYPMMYQSE